MNSLVQSKEKVVAIVGPTCTGKTALSLFLARHIPCEIICCDSRNVYRYFDIGSAKPSKAEQAAVPHHLIDVVEPDENFTAAQFAECATSAIKEISERGKLPIICGGTGFYARALLEGLKMPKVPPNDALRAQLKEQEDKTPGSLHERLKELDPVAAEKLNPRDLFRVIRALEVCLLSGEAFSKLADSAEEPFDVLWIGLTIKDREKLKVLLKKRLKAQFEAGLLAEVEDLLKRFGPTQKVMNTVNYRDLVKYFQGEYTLEQAVEQADRHNYQLARRQLMWFKMNEKINWFYVDEEDMEKIEQEVLQKCQAFLAV